MKYEITAETKYHGPVTLHRIKALEDSDNVKKGDLGGYIEKESNLDQAGRAWVSDDAKVYGNAWVSGNARISDMAEVYGNARISDMAEVYGNARISDMAEVYGNAQLSGQSRVSDDAKVFGDAQIGDGGIVKEKAKISGKVLVGRAIVGGKMEVSGEQTISRGLHDDKTSPYWGDGDGK
jgi:UDP-3-O-[3-hydroxymyristoyl] glucosamine N-acyltransferase